MIMQLDFTKAAKNHLTVTLKNGKILFVCPPQKRLFTQFDRLSRLKDSGQANTDEVYGIVAQMLSNNKQNKVITVKDIEDFDSDDIKLLFKMYVRFLKGEEQNPN